MIARGLTYNINKKNLKLIDTSLQDFDPELWENAKAWLKISCSESDKYHVSSAFMYFNDSDRKECKSFCSYNDDAQPSPHQEIYQVRSLTSNPSMSVNWTTGT